MISEKKQKCFLDLKNLLPTEISTVLPIGKWAKLAYFGLVFDFLGGGGDFRALAPGNGHMTIENAF